MNAFRFASVSVAVGVVLSAAVATVEWRDPSPHRERFVDVAPDVKLEVLDWGGRGRPIVLLAGSGVTAHAYDEFAPNLIADAHVVGITRRGFGASSRPASGYDDQRLADDVFAAIEALGLKKPVLVGHSAAGNEMTTLAGDHPDATTALVYLDAVFDPKDLPVQDAHKMELHARTPAWYRGDIPPTDVEARDFEAYGAYQQRVQGFALPQSELRQMFATNPDGSRGRYLGSPEAGRQMGEGTIKRDYSRVRVPILAFYAGEMPLRTPTPDEQASIDED
jgi:non-heme chloroperoxidase